MRFLPVILVLLSACAQFPELDATATPGVAEAAYPDLVPMETLLTAPEPRATPQARAGVEGRAAALRARADRLRGPVVSTPIKARMRRGVQTAS